MYQIYELTKYTKLSSWNTVSFHNFKSQNFKLSVSNPKNTYVAYVSVLSQISNCQGLGRKNKLDMLKTDRTTRRARVIRDFKPIFESDTLLLECCLCVCLCCLAILRIEGCLNSVPSDSTLGIP